jgi:hypothetical protein
MQVFVEVNDNPTVDKDNVIGLVEQILSGNKGLPSIISLIYYLKKQNKTGNLDFIIEISQAILDKIKYVYKENDKDLSRFNEDLNIKSLTSNQPTKQYDNKLSKYLGDIKKDNKFEEYMIIKYNISNSISKEETELTSLNALKNVRVYIKLGTR